jgi:hypothetical protein
MENNNQYSPRRYSRRITPRIGRVFGWAFIGLMFVCLFALVFGFVVKWLWNMLMPAIFDLGAITFWQAFALIVLAKLLFGSFGGPHRSNRKSWHDWGQRHDWHRPWDRFGEKRDSMRDRFRDWKYYHQFWEDEGKEAFKAYVDGKTKTDKDAGTEEEEEGVAEKPEN